MEIESYFDGDVQLNIKHRNWLIDLVLKTLEQTLQIAYISLFIYWYHFFLVLLHESEVKKKPSNNQTQQTSSTRFSR